MSSKDKNSVTLPQKEGQTLEQLATEYVLDAKTLGALVVDGNADSVSKQVEMEFARAVIGQGVEEIRRGDLSKLEEMLYAQAVALNMMFTSLSRRATQQTNVDIKQTLTNLCLKSQNQSRNTIQTLINLKQPNKTAFIKQQTNVANGHQQINNGAVHSSPEKLVNMPNELLEEHHGKRLDTGTQAKAGAINTGLEAVGTLNWSSNS
jgi:hypothetical protein